MAAALPKLPSLQIRFIKILIIEPVFHGSTKSRENVFFCKLTPQSPSISGNPIRSFCQGNNGQTTEDCGGGGISKEQAGPETVFECGPWEGSEQSLQPLQTGVSYQENAGWEDVLLLPSPSCRGRATQAPGHPHYGSRAGLHSPIHLRFFGPHYPYRWIFLLTWHPTRVETLRATAAMKWKQMRE